MKAYEITFLVVTKFGEITRDIQILKISNNKMKHSHSLLFSGTLSPMVSGK